MSELELRAIVVENKIDKPRLKLAYPKIEDLPNKEAEMKINQSIKALINKVLIDEGFQSDPTKSFWGEYTIETNKNGVLSIKFSINFYAEGAAHGMTFEKSLTFHLAMGHIYTLPELFRMHSNYLARINQFIEKEIKEKDIPLIAEFKGIAPNQDFYLTDDSLVIYFQLYEYTPYAYGIPEFKIPYPNLYDLINRHGPIALLLRNS